MSHGNTAASYLRSRTSLKPTANLFWTRRAGRRSLTLSRLTATGGRYSPKTVP